MNKRNHFEENLPEGYRVAKVIDAKKALTGVIFSVVSFIPVVFAILLFFLLTPSFSFEFDSTVIFTHYFAFLVIIIVYTVLHELTHGAAYKLLTGKKLTFGLTLTVAYCGVPEIYVYRKAALIAILAPFVVFTIVFSGMVIFIPNILSKFFATLVLAIHIGGCCGDLYCALLYLFKFKDPTTLMNDTGPKQTYYVKD